MKELSKGEIYAIATLAATKIEEELTGDEISDPKMSDLLDLWNKLLTLAHTNLSVGTEVIQTIAFYSRETRNNLVDLLRHHRLLSQRDIQTSDPIVGY